MARPDAQAQHAIMDRRNRVASMYLRRFTQAEIARKLGVVVSTVCKDLKAIHKEWAAGRIGDRSAWIERELAAIDRLERTYTRAWVRSCKDETPRTAKTVNTPDGVRTEASKREEGQAGDPRFLEGVRWCINRRIELLGLDAPKKMEHSGPDGAPIPVALSNEERDAIRERIRARLGGPPGAPAGDGSSDAGGPPVVEPDAGDAAGWLDA